MATISYTYEPAKAVLPQPHASYVCPHLYL